MLGWLYGQMINARNALYDKGILASRHLGVRTISIGNITVGGTGKTPLVSKVAGLLADRGETACVLTRGYGRANENRRVLVSDGEKVLADVCEAGDEPIELAHKLLGKAVIVADADRLAAGLWARRKFGVTAFVLDDGFQHRRLQRDLDIVCIDATDPFGSGKMLPFGRMRESPKGLRRAHCVVITRADQADGIESLERQLRTASGSAKIFSAGNRLTGLADLKTGSSREPAGPLFAFCGLGNPDSFYTTLTANGRHIVGTRAFGDHHKYVQGDVDMLIRSARQAGAAALVTTAKDAVKLEALQFDLRCYVAEVEIEMSDPEGFAALL